MNFWDSRWNYVAIDMNFESPLTLLLALRLILLLVINSFNESLICNCQLFIIILIRIDVI